MSFKPLLDESGFEIALELECGSSPGFSKLIVGTPEVQFVMNEFAFFVLEFDFDPWFRNFAENGFSKLEMPGWTLSLTKWQSAEHNDEFGAEFEITEHQTGKTASTILLCGDEDADEIRKFRSLLAKAE